MKNKNKNYTSFRLFLPKNRDRKKENKNKENCRTLRKDCFAGFFKLKYGKIIVMSIIFAIIFEFIGFPTPILANEAVLLAKNQEIKMENGVILGEKESELLRQKLIIKERLPKNKEFVFMEMGIRTITAYSSTVDQTDDSPCITANMFNVCAHGREDTIAANFLKFGTKVRIPELFGDRIFIVRDRMNKRYPDRVDVWMIKRSAAKQFGVKYAQIEIAIEE